MNLVDLIFPKKCVGCKKEGSYLCLICKKKIVLIQKPFCPACHKLTVNGQYCSRCRSHFALTGVLIAAHYDDPLKQAIQISKYQKIYTLYKELSSLVLYRFQLGLPRGSLLLCSIPLYPVRKLSRGFNQSEIITQELSQNLDIEILQGLKRIKNTQSQAKLSRKKRFENVKNAFQFCGDKNSISGKTILLVDDVITTGATLSSAAKPLLNAGVRNVWGVVLAKH
ncbi:ComF family protein [Patescibacteria group bacterium]